MTYLCKFNNDGKRIATVVEGVHYTTAKQKKAYIKEGYVETSAEDYAYYVGNKGTGANGTGYVRGTAGKPTDAPAHTPSTEEQKAAIVAQYEADKDGLVKYYADAALHDDTELMAELKEEMTALDAQFAADMKELEG